MPGLSRGSPRPSSRPPRDAVERVAGAHDDGRGAGRGAGDGAGRRLVLPEARANDEHGNGDGEEEGHGRRDPRDLGAIDAHQPAAAQTALARRAASAPATARQSSAGASRYA